MGRMSMIGTSQEPERRVLIASANPLFAKGLRKMMAQRWEGRRVEVRLAASMDEATAALEDWDPDLVIVDYDDVDRPGNIQRGAFLSHFITGERPMQVMLVSLRESGEVVVYDRRTLTPAQAEDWLDLPWEPSVPQKAEQAAAKSPAKRSGGMKHYLIVGAMTIVLTLLVGFGLITSGLMPVQASEQARTVDAMLDLQVWMISFLFALIVSFILYSVFVFRQKQGGERVYGAYFKGSAGLEVFWTLVPLGTVIFLAFLGARDLAKVLAPEPNALDVKVTAFQWGWQFEYPVQGVKSSTLYLPVNRQAHFILTSRDVIHSFWVPEFRLKQDVLPGENLVKELRITPDRIGDYKVRCAEMCGGAHALMESPVKVVSEQDFNAWIDSQTNTANLTPAERGQKLTSVCMGCHSIDGKAGVGPTWKGLAGSQVTLSDGTTVTADDAYLHTSIVEPNKQIAKGFPPGVMPQGYQSQFSDQQIQDMIAFIKTLK
jgi:cytochrome c oxidase subunit 2